MKRSDLILHYRVGPVKEYVIEEKKLERFIVDCNGRGYTVLSGEKVPGIKNAGKMKVMVQRLYIHKV